MQMNEIESSRNYIKNKLKIKELRMKNPIEKLFESTDFHFEQNYFPKA